MIDDSLICIILWEKERERYAQLELENQSLKKEISRYRSRPAANTSSFTSISDPKQASAATAPAAAAATAPANDHSKQQTGGNGVFISSEHLQQAMAAIEEVMEQNTFLWEHFDLIQVNYLIHFE
jgi:hypothetical protein